MVVAGLLGLSSCLRKPGLYGGLYKAISMIVMTGAVVDAVVEDGSFLVVAHLPITMPLQPESAK